MLSREVFLKFGPWLVKKEGRLAWSCAEPLIIFTPKAVRSSYKVFSDLLTKQWNKQQNNGPYLWKQRSCVIPRSNEIRGCQELRGICNKILPIHQSCVFKAQWILSTLLSVVTSVRLCRVPVLLFPDEAILASAEFRFLCTLGQSVWYHLNILLFIYWYIAVVRFL